MLKTLRLVLDVIVGAFLLLLVSALVSPPWGRMVVRAATAPLMAGMVSGQTNQWAVPAYLLPKHLSATTVGVTIKAGPGVLGCVTVNKAGAAGSLLTLYNSFGAISTYELAIIDTTTTNTRCFGIIFSGALTAAVSSSGAAPDLTIGYR